MPHIAARITPLKRFLVNCRYGLNIGFNLWNKQVFNYFPYPWTVSAVHVVVGLLYCTASYLLGFKKASFGRVSSTEPYTPFSSIYRYGLTDLLC